jgi:hypothetical protein
VSSAQRIPTAVNLGFLDPEPLSYTHEAEWTPYQTHYFSENLVALGIEPGISGFVAYATDRKVVGSTPDEVTGFFN